MGMNAIDSDCISDMHHMHLWSSSIIIAFDSKDRTNVCSSINDAFNANKA
jgi:hypothetical protein